MIAMRQKGLKSIKAATTIIYRNGTSMLHDVLKAHFKQSISHVSEEHEERSNLFQSTEGIGTAVKRALKYVTTHSSDLGAHGEGPLQVTTMAGQIHVRKGSLSDIYLPQAI